MTTSGIISSVSAAASDASANAVKKDQEKSEVASIVSEALSKLTIQVPKNTGSIVLSSPSTASESSERSASPSTTSSEGSASPASSVRSASPSMEALASPSAVSCPEGTVNVTSGSSEILNYGAITSCMTVTARLANGGVVGAHFVRVPKSPQQAPLNVLREFHKKMGEQTNAGNATVRIDVIGVLDVWNGIPFRQPGKRIDEVINLQFPKVPCTFRAISDSNVSVRGVDTAIEPLKKKS